MEEKEIPLVLENIGRSTCHNTRSGKWSIEKTRDSSCSLRITMEMGDFLQKLLAYQEHLKSLLDSGKMNSKSTYIDRRPHQNYLQIHVETSQRNEKTTLYISLNKFFEKLHFHVFVENTYNGVIVIFKSKKDFDETAKILYQSSGLVERRAAL